MLKSNKLELRGDSRFSNNGSVCERNPGVASRAIGSQIEEKDWRAVASLPNIELALYLE